MGLGRGDQGARRRRCRDIGDDERRRDRPQPPSARRVAAGRHRFLCRSFSTMSLTSRRRRFANSTPSRSPQTLPYSWDKTLDVVVARKASALIKQGHEVGGQEDYGRRRSDRLKRPHWPVVPSESQYPHPAHIRNSLESELL